MHRTSAVVAAAALLAGMAAGNAQAGILAIDGNGLAAWRGTAVMEHLFDGPTVTMDVDYCVYAPGDFAESFGFDPGAGRYVYAYQIVDNPGNYAVQLSLHLDDDEDANNISYIAASAYGFDPNVARFADFTALWLFNPVLPADTDSTILYFTSPWGPEWDNAALTGNDFFSDMVEVLPSPTPEPGTLIMLAAGGILVLGRRSIRARRRGPRRSVAGRRRRSGTR